MYKLKSIFTSIIILIFFSNTAFSEKKWQRMSGKWVVENSSAIEKFGNTSFWGYYEILNLNSIQTLKPLDSYNIIDINSTLYDRLRTPSEFMISFAIRSESESWFYHIYALKFTGNYWGLNKVSFVFSDRIDKSKPFSTKNNVFIKELESANCKIKYGKSYNYRITIEGEHIVLYINGEKILFSQFPEKSHEGRVAISAKNVKIAIDKVLVKNNDKIIFEDDFNENSIYVRTTNVKKQDTPKDKKETQPE